MQAYTSPRRFLGDSRFIIWCLGVVVAAGIILTGFFYNRHEIRIYADGKETKVIMRGGTVGEAVKKANIALGDRDIIEPSLDTAITKNFRVNIKRMLSVTLVADGKTTEQTVPVGTVEQTLRNLNVVLNPGDQIVPEKTTVLKSGDTIEVTRFSNQYLDQLVKTPFKVDRRDDSSMERGVTRIVRRGEEGLMQNTIKITLKNGKEIKRELIGQKILREPVNKIVAVGTVRSKVVSRGGSIRFSRALVMSASAYSHTGHNTASGIYPYRGAVAVDPQVIPLGTKIFVEGYGYATALDIGSAIQGNRIDLFFDSESQALRWGRRSVKVYVLQ